MESNLEVQAIIELMLKDQNVRRELSRQSFRLFFGTHFGHYIQYPFAPFHIEMFQLAQDPTNQTIVIMGARNSAKSAIMNTALSIWSVLGAPQNKFVVITSRTTLKAKQHFMNMRRELEDNKLLRGDLGPFETEEGEWGSSIVLKKYDAKITFASVEQSIRGIRHKQYKVDMLVADDIEDGDSVRTIDGRNKTYDWLTKDSMPASDLKTVRVVLLGTLLHEDSVMIRFKKDIESGKRSGVYREYPVIDAAGTILWKGKYPDLAAIEIERLRIGDDKAWAQEFLLRIVSDHERVVHPEWIQYEECPAITEVSGYRGTFIGIDPAISQERKACFTAMVIIRVFGWGDKMRIYVLPYPVNERMELPVTIERAKALSNTYGNGNKAKIYVEDVGIQRGIAQLLSDQGYPAEGVRPQGDKRARVALMSHHIKNGTLRFAPRGNEELVMQLVNFGSESYMDLADALSMVVPEVVNGHQGYRPFPDMTKYMKSREKGEDGYGQYDGRPIFRGLKRKIL